MSEMLKGWMNLYLVIALQACTDQKDKFTERMNENSL